MDSNYFAPDITNVISATDVIRYSPTFAATGLTFTGTGMTYPTYNSHYVKIGKLVSFYVEVNLSTVTNFGTGQYSVQLPFLPLLNSLNHFTGWVWQNIAVPADDSNHIILDADHMANTKTLDLHFLVGAPANPKPVIEQKLTQANLNSHAMTTSSRIYINGTYIIGE